mmetsp:Transcript_26428/g.57951  ORF Transcript_26428/g.57951 Transcript_26428/m.57951 type:complete len:97 (+) Transcript_26428:847-1137(+)
MKNQWMEYCGDEDVEDQDDDSCPGVTYKSKHSSEGQRFCDVDFATELYRYSSLSSLSCAFGRNVMMQTVDDTVQVVEERTSLMHGNIVIPWLVRLL